MLQARKGEKVSKMTKYVSKSLSISTAYYCSSLASVLLTSNQNWEVWVGISEEYV